MGISNYLNLLSALITKRKLIYVHFGITHRCNFQCRMCNIWRLPDGNQELSLEQIKNLAEILKSIGTVVISLGGGEPFLRKDLKEIIKIFIQKGFIVRLLTNGTLIKEEDIRILVKLGLRNISVSLDTLSAKKQSLICNQNGVWNRIIDNLILISKFFLKKRSLLLVNTTVSRLNIEELPLLTRFAGKLGYYISFIPLEPVTARHAGVCSGDYPSEFKITSQDHKIVDRIYDQLIDMKTKMKNNIFNSSRFLENSRQFLKTSQVNWRCDAGKLYFSINPQGDSSICHRFHTESKHSNFNLRAFLKSQDSHFKHERLVRDCPGCMRPCWAEITHMVRDKKSFWEMARIEISTWNRRRFNYCDFLIQKNKIFDNEDTINKPPE